MPPPTILLVDDQKHMLLLLQASVDRLACRVLTAVSGAEALAKAAATPIDLLLIDYEMPGLTGIQVAQQLRRSPEYANLPIVLITARGQQRIRTEAARVGVTLVLTKPFSPAELQETLQFILTQSKNSVAV